MLSGAPQAADVIAICSFFNRLVIPYTALIKANRFVLYKTTTPNHGFNKHTIYKQYSFFSQYINTTTDIFIMTHALIII